MFGKKFKREVKVEGMHCKHCAATVEREVGAIEGVKSVKADPESGAVEIVSTQEIADEMIASAVEKAGFKFVG